MLYKELQKIVATIEFYDNKEGWRAFVEELMDRDLTALKGLRTFPSDEDKVNVVHWARMSVGAGWYGRLVKPLPVVIEIMAEVIRDRLGPAYSRTALAGALAYLVQQNDIIPDSAGGGYGLVDDAIVIYYAYNLYLKQLGDRVPEISSTMEKYAAELETVIRTGFRIFPKGKVSDLKQVLSHIAMGFYHLVDVPSYILEQIIEQVVQKPGQNGIEQILSRLAYHLNIRFQPYDKSVYSDPILSMLDAMESESGVAPGEMTSEGYYY